MTDQDHDQEPTEPPTDDKPIEARIKLDDHENPVIRSFTDEADGPAVRALRQAMMANDDPRYGGGAMVWGHVEDTPKKRGRWFQFTLVLILQGAARRYHMRAARGAAHDWLGELPAGSFVGIVCVPRHPGAAEVVYIFQFDPIRDGKRVRAFAGLITGGLSIWERLSNATGRQVDDVSKEV